MSTWNDGSSGAGPDPRPTPQYQNRPDQNPQYQNPQYQNPQYQNPPYQNPQYPNPQFGGPSYPPNGGWPGMPAYPNSGPPPAVGTNGLAIAGFVCSFFCAIVGLILSIIGYNQCKERNQPGQKLALAGIIISGSLLFVLSMAFLADL